MQTVYVTGKITATTPGGYVWMILGIYTTEEQARALCTDSFCFVGPVDLDSPLPEKYVTGPGIMACYPYMA